VPDYHIYENTSDRNLKFVLLWSCHQGEEIGGTHLFSGSYGQPYCWLHTTNLSGDGYANPDLNGYTFIGFNGSSPGLYVTEGTFSGDKAYWFLGHFYERALCNGFSINDALDYAAQEVWDVDFFLDCVLHTGYTLPTGNTGNMVVYGDGSLAVGSAPSLPPPPPPPSSPPPGGGCPVLSVWDGVRYVDYGVIDIHNPEGCDVIREVPVKKEDVCVEGFKAKFKLCEGWAGLNYSHSTIDQVKLYAVDADGSRHLCPLTKAVHSIDGNVLLKLLLNDDRNIDMFLMDTLDLTFVVLWPSAKIQSYVFLIEGCNIIKIPD